MERVLNDVKDLHDIKVSKDKDDGSLSLVFYPREGEKFKQWSSIGKLLPYLAVSILGYAPSGANTVWLIPNVEESLYKWSVVPVVKALSSRRSQFLLSVSSSEVKEELEKAGVGQIVNMEEACAGCQAHAEAEEIRSKQ